jgi:hypothetical protein
MAGRWRLEATVEAQGDRLCANPAGSLLATNSPGGFVQVLSALSGRLVRRITRTRMARPASLSWSASGASILLAGARPAS